MKMISNLGWGGRGLNSNLAKLVKGLMAPKVSVLTGAAASTAIAVTGMSTSSMPVILSAVMYASGVPSVVTATAVGDGTVKFTEDTTGNKVVLTWFDDVYGS